MEEANNITDRTIIILGNLGKLIYRIFIVVILYNIYTHLMGETTTLAVSTFILMFPIIWVTMKELSQDLEVFDSKPLEDIKNTRIKLLEQTLSDIQSQLKDGDKLPLMQLGIEAVLNDKES